MLSESAFEGSRHQVAADGVWREVIELGEGDPIVLVPGLAGGWRLLMPLARVLAKWRRVILFDYADEQGGRQAPAESLADYARDLAAVIDGLRLERPTVMGVSFGGAVALEYALTYPHRIDSLVLSGVEPQFRSTLGATIAQRVLERFPLPADNPFVNQFFNLLHAGKPEPGPLTQFIIERCWTTNPATMARRMAMLDGFDVADRLWELDVPTLLLAGSRDVVVPHARQVALANLIADARVETLEGAGHVGFLTHAGDVAQHVERMRFALHPTHA